MSDVTLSDGREITVNLATFTIKEYRNIFDFEQGTDEALAAEDALISKAVGIKTEEYQNLPFSDWQAIQRTFYQKIRRPLDDPN